MPRRSSRVALVSFAAVAAVDLVAELAGWRSLALVCRAVLMPLLAWFCWSTAPRRTRLVIVVVAALLLSWLGDFVGSAVPEQLAVPVKIVFFLAAQILYGVGFWPYRRWSLLARPPLLLLYAAAITGLIGVVTIAAGPLAVPVAVYGASLAAMAVLATGVGRLAGIGGACFLVSDIVLAVEAFVAPGLIPAAAFVNMALYLPAQLMITLGVLRQVSAEVLEPVA